MISWYISGELNTVTPTVVFHRSVADVKLTSSDLKNRREAFLIPVHSKDEIADCVDANDWGLPVVQSEGAAADVPGEES